MVDVVVPSAVIDEGDAVISEAVMLAAPTVKSTVALSVMEDPFRVPVTVAVPASVEDVNVAV